MLTELYDAQWDGKQFPENIGELDIHFDIINNDAKWIRATLVFPNLHSGVVQHYFFDDNLTRFEAAEAIKKLPGVKQFMIELPEGIKILRAYDFIRDRIIETLLIASGGHYRFQDFHRTDAGGRTLLMYTFEYR